MNAKAGTTLLGMTIALLSNADKPPARSEGWYILRWIEKPARRGPPQEARPEDRTRFIALMSFDKESGLDTFEHRKAELREGDVIAYRMGKWEARKEIMKGHLNKIGYRLLEYGHLAIVVRSPSNPSELRLLSSHSFKGVHLREGLTTLRDNSWDCYRLDRWDRVDTDRLREFVEIATSRAGHWTGYDFAGMFGITNSELRPEEPRDIDREYHCSTAVVAALYYAGLELDAIRRGGIADVVSPKQVVTSTGRLMSLPQGSTRKKRRSAGHWTVRLFPGGRLPENRADNTRGNDGPPHICRRDALPATASAAHSCADAGGKATRKPVPAQPRTRGGMTRRAALRLSRWSHTIWAPQSTLCGLAVGADGFFTGASR